MQCAFVMQRKDPWCVHLLAQHAVMVLWSVVARCSYLCAAAPHPMTRASPHLNTTRCSMVLIVEHGAAGSGDDAMGSEHALAC